MMRVLRELDITTRTNVNFIVKDRVPTQVPIKYDGKKNKGTPDKRRSLYHHIIYAGIIIPLPINVIFNL
jgi:hypothetical protein